MDSDQKDQLIEVIEKLLADKTTVGALWEDRTSDGKGTDRRWFKFFYPSHSHPLALLPQLVAGSVVMAFEEVCPERIDLIHKNYRKLCNLLIDVEEWGQVVIISMLTRYARTQFLSPTQNVSSGLQSCGGEGGPPGKAPTDPPGRVPSGVLAGGEPREGVLWLRGG